MIFIGTAGWSIPARFARRLPGQGSHLERHGARLHCAEINSSFYKPHQKKTYERWAASVPDDFRFSAKLPKAISHERKLQDYREPLDRFLSEVEGLGEKLAVLLTQLPPKLAYDRNGAASFFRDLGRAGYTMACEPRHVSWFETSAEDLLSRGRIARVAADPAPTTAGLSPGGWAGLRYWRLHGSPQTYRSSYGGSRLAQYAEAIVREGAAGREAWCIFDNTATSAAAGDALHLQQLCAALV